ncbi:MAG: histidine kinase [Bacteroidota bacterium]|nr:histidine kinase [Bacteroidota bacterium]
MNSNEIWGTDIANDVFRFNTSLWTTQFYNSEKSNPNALITSNTKQIIAGDKGSIFIATDKGLQYMDTLKPPFTILHTNDIVFPPFKLTVAEDDQGIFWLANAGNVLLALNPKDIHIEKFTFPGTHKSIQTISTYNKDFLLGTDNGMWLTSPGSKNIKPVKTDYLQKFPFLVQQEYYFIMKDEHDFHWICYPYKGLLKYNFNTGEYFFIDKDTLADSGRITAVTIDDEKRIWIASSMNVISAVNTSDNSFIKVNMPQLEEFEHVGPIQSLIIDHVGNLWIATLETGLFKYHISTASFTSYDTRQGISSNYLGAMQIDQQGQIWINTINGLNKFDPISEEFTIYDSSDGLSFSGYNFSSMTLSKDGNIFIWSDNSITFFNPKDFHSNPNFPTLVFSIYKKSGEQFYITPDDKQLNFSYKDKMITFEFRSINFIDPTKTEYAYMLDGYDDVWNYPGNHPDATYTSLPAGDYKFRIKTTNKHGFWDVPEKTMNIHVAGPLWRKWWFITACLIFSLFLVYGVNQYRFAQFKKIQTLRNRISKDLHDDIGSTLSSISIISTAASKMKDDRYPEIQDTISLMGVSARSAMENMSDIVWAINPSNDTFKNMIDRLQLFANQLLEVKNIKFQINITESLKNVKLDMRQRKNVYLILREAIHNVAKYSQASQCFISAKIVDKKIELQVSDNGIGFDEHILSLGGNGLINMKERAAEIKAIFTIHSDKQNGTSISLQFNHK